MNEFKTFKEISIGGVLKVQLINQLVEKGIQFNKYAQMLFAHSSFSVGHEIEKVKLAKVNLSDLRITKPCFYQEIVGSASDLGLKLCPIYLGAFLRLAYLEQPEGPYLTIASVMPENDENYPNGFYVRNLENSLWLRGYKASDDYEWPIDSEFIFQK
jgi:hypothetical protein